MKKRFTQIARSLSLGIVVGLTAVALLVSGADAASRLFSAYHLDKSSEPVQSAQAEITISPVEAAENSNGMEPTGQPDGEPVGYWQTLQTISGSGPQRGRVPVSSLSVLESPSAGPIRPTGLTATSCQVSSCLGRLFTLVGAKPSGTS